MRQKWKEAMQYIYHSLFDEPLHQIDDFHLEEISDSSKNVSEENSNSSWKTQSADFLENDKQQIYSVTSLNLEYMKSIYNSMINSDIEVREFLLNARNRQYHAFIMYIDGMVNNNLLNQHILKPLMLKNMANSYNGSQNQVISEVVSNNITVRKVKKFNISEYILSCLLPQNSVKKVSYFHEIIEGINAGNCALFVDSINIAFCIEAKGFEQRSLEKPNNEMVVRGEQVAFTENLRTNTSLLRRYVNNENLIIENMNVGTLSKTPCAVCYLKNVTNDDLVAEVKYRINNLKIDYIISSGTLEQLIQDNNNISLPQMISTERPDKAVNYLFEGRVIIIVNGSPFILVAPGILSDFLSSPEDLNVKHQYANLFRGLRYIAVFLTLALPGIYMAITNFHQELIPTELLFAIVASRESVPFPIFFELLVMEMAFELIREASIRVPNPVGPTLGIVGALILGQAAVQASIVSPILIIIVSVTAICSFTIPDISLSIHVRIIRFVYLILGAIGGFLGLAITLTFHLIVLFSMKSFGVSYVEPQIYPSTFGKGLFLSPLWKQEKRSPYLKTKRPLEEDKISMNWKFSKGDTHGS